MTQTIVEIARQWIGTPYQHQAACKGAGTDCLGLIRGIWREAVGQEPVIPPAYTVDWSEPSGDERLWRAAQEFLSPCPDQRLEPGRVVLFRMKDNAVAKHLGVISAADPVPRFIHAYTGHGVVENTLSAPWQRRIVGVFAFPISARGEF